MLGVRPTHAGVSPSQWSGSWVPRNPPYARGGEPTTPHLVSGSAMSGPHAAGAEGCGESVCGGRPAHEGVSSAEPSRSTVYRSVGSPTLWGCWLSSADAVGWSHYT